MTGCEFPSSKQREKKMLETLGQLCPVFTFIFIITSDNLHQLTLQILSSHVRTTSALKNILPPESVDLKRVIGLRFTPKCHVVSMLSMLQRHPIQAPPNHALNPPEIPQGNTQILKCYQNSLQPALFFGKMGLKLLYNFCFPQNNANMLEN